MRNNVAARLSNPRVSVMLTKEEPANVVPEAPSLVSSSDCELNSCDWLSLPESKLSVSSTRSFRNCIRSVQRSRTTVWSILVEL